MELKPGYKQTDIGVFSDEWEVAPVRTVAAVEGGYAFSSKKFVIRGKYQVVKMSNLYAGTLDLNRSASYLDEIDEQERHYLLRENDILITLTGTTGKQDYGYSHRITDEQNLLLNQRVGRLIVGENADPSYIAFQIKSPSFLDQFFQVSKGGTGNQTNVGTGDVASMHLPLPPIHEQRAIAAALENVHALLRALTHLIAKKRDLKRAVMQQMFTGKIRLTDAIGQWETSTLKQAAEIQPGINKSVSEMGSGTLYVTVQDLYDGTSIRTQRLGRIRVSPQEVQARSLRVGDIVLGKSSVKRDGIGYPSQFLGCGEPVVCSGFTYRVRALKGIADATFLFYALRSNKTRQWVIDNSQASALTNINRSIADAIPIPLPPIAEQAAIASVLSDMDSELAALEQRRDKTYALKQGVMQELLTGRIRLV